MKNNKTGGDENYEKQYKIYVKSHAMHFQILVRIKISITHKENTQKMLHSRKFGLQNFIVIDEVRKNRNKKERRLHVEY